MKKIIHTKDCVENQSTLTRIYLICYKWHSCGGYTHSSYVFTDTVLHDVDSFDECSAYPYTLVTNKFPMSSFRKCNITKRKQMTKRFAYLIVVRFFDLKCKYLNHFISGSKCYEIKGAKYDNGRIYECDECKMVLTDVDFYFILDTHKCTYKIEECYFSKYDYLPIQYINFVLDKYENKTKYKDDESKKLQYQKEKNKYNAIFGMTVTNTIRKNVDYIDETGEWLETDLTNDEIIEKLDEEKKKAFLSFRLGVLVHSICP